MLGSWLVGLVDSRGIMSMDVAAYMQRLAAVSEDKGIAYGRAHLIFDAERQHAESSLEMKGYLALSDAFKCFFLETAESLNTQVKGNINKPLTEFYALFVPRLAHSFQTMCGAERVAIQGYPLHGYTLLRNTFDTAVLASAALQRLTDFYSIEGIEPGKGIDPVRMRRLRKATEQKVREQMTGSKSGLSQATITELSMWDSLFDYETHGGRLSLSSAANWMRGIEPLPILPKYNQRSFAMFVNRYCEVAWMVHRLVPLVQPPSVLLSDSWGEKWAILDESFELMVHALTEENGKPIGAAIVEFVKAKFPFNAKTNFTL